MPAEKRAQLAEAKLRVMEEKSFKLASLIREEKQRWEMENVELQKENERLRKELSKQPKNTRNPFQQTSSNDMGSEWQLKYNALLREHEQVKRLNKLSFPDQEIQACKEAEARATQKARYLETKLATIKDQIQAARKQYEERFSKYRDRIEQLETKISQKNEKLRKAKSTIDLLMERIKLAKSLTSKPSSVTADSSPPELVPASNRRDKPRSKTPTRERSASQPYSNNINEHRGSRSAEPMPLSAPVQRMKKVRSNENVPSNKSKKRSTSSRINKKSRPKSAHLSHAISPGNRQSFKVHDKHTRLSPGAIKLRRPKSGYIPPVSGSVRFEPVTKKHGKYSENVMDELIDDYDDDQEHPARLLSLSKQEMFSDWDGLNDLIDDVLTKPKKPHQRKK